MGEAQVDGLDGPRVTGPEEMAGRFYAELTAAMPGWKQRLAEDPEQFGPLEHDVHAAFARGADLVLTGLLALVMKQPTFDAACEQTRRHSRHPLRQGRMRTLRVRLLGGLVVWITSLYCAPAKRRSGDTDVTAGIACGVGPVRVWQRLLSRPGEQGESASGVVPFVSIGGGGAGA